MKYVSFAERMGFPKDTEERIENAFKLGFEQGLKQGILIGKVHLCQELLKLPLTPEDKLLKMPQKGLAALLAPLRKQLGLDGG